MSSDPAATQAGDPAPARPEGQPSAAAGTAHPKAGDAAATDATAFNPGAENVASAQTAPTNTTVADAAAAASLSNETAGPVAPRKGPLSFLSGALTSGLLAWVCLGLSGRVVGYYAEHPPHYDAQIAQSIATALKTLIVGMCFLATFSFAFIGIGLLLTFLRSLRPAVAARPS